MGEIKDKTIAGLKWSVIERFSLQITTFVIGLIMARLLSPSDYGVIGMLSIFLAISQTFIDSGFGNALIRRLNNKDIDFCTVFYFNIVVSTVCYLLLFILAPYIADFFNYPLLKNVLRVVPINLFISSLNAVHIAKFTIAVDFKTLAKCSLISTILSGIAGILMAYNGLGVWALVFQQVIHTVITTLAIWHYSRWRPRLAYSWQSFHELFSYGSKLLMAGLLHTVYNNLSSLVIGKFYTPKDLGNYSRGDGFASLACSNITGVLQRVTFPIFAKLQNDDEHLIHVYRKYISFTSMVIFFVMVLLAALSKPLIIFLLTDKWEGAVIYSQILCFAWMFDHICAMNLNILQVKGRSDLFLRLEIIKKSISFAILLSAIPFGVLAICVSRVVYTQIAVIINTYYTGKVFRLGYFVQVKDFGKYLLVSLVAVAPAYFLTFFDMPVFGVLIVGGVLSTLLYLATLHMIKDSYYNELYGIVRNYIKNR